MVAGDATISSVRSDVIGPFVHDVSFYLGRRCGRTPEKIFRKFQITPHASQIVGRNVRQNRQQEQDAIRIEIARRFFHAVAMAKRDPRVDAYIAKAADFAKPILNRVRKLVHTTCPHVEETIKWNAPFFVYKGILAAMPAFKKHCALIFWKGKIILGKERMKLRRLTSLAELPGDKVLLDCIRKAVKLNEAGIKVARPKTKKKIAVPDYFLATLKKN